MKIKHLAAVSLTSLFATSACLALCASTAWAQRTLFWTGDYGNWENTGSWRTSNGIYALPGLTDTAAFGLSLNYTNLLAYLHSTQTLHGIEFTSSSEDYGIYLGNGAAPGATLVLGAGGIANLDYNQFSVTPEPQIVGVPIRLSSNSTILTRELATTTVLSAALNTSGFRLAATGNGTTRFAGTVTGNGDLAVFQDEKGILDVTGTASFREGTIAEGAGSFGNVTVTGLGTLQFNRLDVGGGGTAAVSLLGGGKMVVQNMRLGYVSGATMSVKGNGSELITETLKVGSGPGADGVLTLSDGGAVTVTDRLEITAGSSVSIGSTKALTVGRLEGNGVLISQGFGSGTRNTLEQTGDSVFAGSLSVGTTGTGGIVKTGNGKLTLTGGTDAAPIAIPLLNVNGGAVILNGGASRTGGRLSLNSTQIAENAPLLVNTALEVRNGAKLYVSGSAYIGHDAGANASVIVSGAGSNWKNDDYLIVGGRGGPSVNGMLRIEAGGTVTADEIYVGGSFIGGSDSETGEVIVNGAGSSLTGTFLNIGNTRFDGLGSGTGSMRVENGASLRTTATRIGNGGVGSLTISGAASSWVNDVSITVFADGTLNLAGGANITSRDISGNGVITLDNAGAATAVTFDSPDNNQVVSTLSGVIRDAPNKSGGLTKKGTNRMTISGNNTYTGETVVEAGILRLGGTSASSAFRVASGATLDLGTAGLTLNNGQIVSGNGTVTGNLTNAGGIVSPGTSPGTLQINGNYSQGATGVLSIEIASLTSFDRLLISGSASLGGTLNVAFTNGYEPVVGTSLLAFDFLNTGGSLTGFFQTVNVTGGNLAPRGYTTTLTQSPNGSGFRLAFVVVPEPNAGLLALLGAVPGALCLRRRRCAQA